MCPACIASTAAMVAGAGSAGGILAVCLGKFRQFFRASVLSLLTRRFEQHPCTVRGETTTTYGLGSKWCMPPEAPGEPEPQVEHLPSETLD
jgi:hypothetical protein